jgi:hypothetical protein
MLGSLLASLLLVASVLGNPLPAQEITVRQDDSNIAAKLKYPVIPSGLLCSLPVIKRVLCPRQGATTFTVTTLIGQAKGVEDNGAFRYAVKYASASRWASPTLATQWTLPYVKKMIASFLPPSY